VGNGDLAPIATERVPLEVAADHDPEPLAISACRTVTVKGIVTDEDDLPVDGVQVRTAASEQSVTTDKAGRFELSGVPSRGKVQLYAMKQPKFALVALEDCDESEPQTLVLRSQQSGGAATLTKGTPTPQLPLYALADGDSVDWKPVKGRQTLLVFAPLWHPTTHDILARAKAWATEQDAQLAIVSTDWSLDAARREADDCADLVSDANPILFAGPGGIEIAKDWNLKGPAQAYLINANGKIAAAPPPGSLP
jgi:hypothetical protein